MIIVLGHLVCIKEKYVYLINPFCNVVLVERGIQILDLLLGGGMVWLSPIYYIAPVGFIFVSVHLVLNLIGLVS